MLSILAVMSSLLFVEVTKIFMEAVERGEDFSFVAWTVSLTTLKGCGIFCEEFKNCLQEKQTTLLNNELSDKFRSTIADNRRRVNRVGVAVSE